MSDSQDLLQHPRRNLGNRYRSTAQKFANLAMTDPNRAKENLDWAEQHARQAVLHDFTDERNWQCLAEIKELHEDADGLHALLEDVFIVLGRDVDNLSQLRGIDFLRHGRSLLSAAFVKDSLDPDTWWSTMQTQGEAALVNFTERCRRLDFRDQRANIIFGRRLERIRQAGHIEIFVELARHLLAHRPMNHELWFELGRLHERRGEIDLAWSCYDQVQQLRPHSTERDRFLERLKGDMDGKEKSGWSGPSVEHREAFLKAMQDLTARVSSPMSVIPEVVSEPEELPVHPDEPLLLELIEKGDVQAAFFLARRLMANGETWAESYMTRIQQDLQ